MAERSYDAAKRYGQSKLANLLYACELQRRLAQRCSSAVAIGCHPGYAATSLQAPHYRALLGVLQTGGSSRRLWEVTEGLAGPFFGD